MMKKVYGDDCLSYSRIHEWFKRFQEGREALEDDERSSQPRNVVNEENAEIVREFIRKEPKSSLKYMESELGISAASSYRNLTENLGYIKVCAKFVMHTLKPHEKALRIQHSRDIIKEAKKNRNEKENGKKGKEMLTLMLFIPKDDLEKSSDSTFSFDFNF